MGRRSRFERNPRDAYFSPYAVVVPLLPHLAAGTRFAEPCCGNMALVRHLEKHGHVCTWASDIQPQDEPAIVCGTPVLHKGHKLDVFDVVAPLQQSDCIITNTPWNRKILHPMLEHFRALTPAWLLLDADWAFAKQASDYMKYCSKIVAVGRCRWIEGTKHMSKDSAAWYRFEQEPSQTVFVGR